MFNNVVAQPTEVPFRDCMTRSSTEDDGLSQRRINVTAVYSQVADYGDNPMLKMVVIGSLGQNFVGATPEHLCE